MISEYCGGGEEVLGRECRGGGNGGPECSRDTIEEAEGILASTAALRSAALSCSGMAAALEGFNGEAAAVDGGASLFSTA